MSLISNKRDLTKVSRKMTTQKTQFGTITREQCSRWNKTLLYKEFSNYNESIYLTEEVSTCFSQFHSMLLQAL